MDIFRRPLLPCVLAYISGLWLVHEIAHVWPAAAWGMGVGLMAAAGWLAWSWRVLSPVLLLMLVLAGALVMGVRERRAARAEVMLQQWDTELPRMVSGVVRESVAAQLEDGLHVELSDVRITSGSAELPLPGRMRVYLEKTMLRGGVLPVPGSRIGFVGYVERPVALKNFFGYDRAEVFRHREIYSAGRPLAVREIAVIDRRSAGLRGWLHSRLMDFRTAVSESLTRSMWPQEARLMRAMLFNDMRVMSDEEKAIFRESGTLHLFAVSGLHVAVLGAVIGMLFRALRFGFRGSWVATALVMLLYLWMVDFVPSATRAYLMLAALTVGQLLQREVDTLSSLVLAVAVIVALDPAAVWDAGFLLSVSGVLGICVLTPLMRLWFWHEPEREPGWRGRLQGWFMDALFVTASVTLALLPLQVWYFGFWNALSVAANLVLAGLSTLVLSVGLLTAMLGLFWDFGGAAAGAATSLLMSGLYWTAEVAAEAEWAMFYFRRIPAWLFMLSLAVLLGGYYCVFRSTPEFLVKSRARFACHAMCGLGMLVAFQVYDQLKPGRLEIWMLDVGQGDATLVRLPGGQTVLLDGGRSQPNMGAMVVIPQLRGLGIDTLDYVVATHDDDDHTGGLAEVIERVGARRLLLPVGFEAKSQSSVKMLEAARRQGCIVQYLAAGDLAMAGACRVRVLNPPADVVLDEDNEMSVALAVEYGDFRALLMGDAGLLTEARLVNEWGAADGDFADGVTLLKLGHHGSKTASGAEFLERARPALALVSCGANNSFRHPAAEVVERVESVGARLLRTDVHGAVILSTNGQDVQVRTARRGGL